MQQLHCQVMNVIRNFNLFSVDSKVLLGVSGGADSVALLNLFSTINRTSNICSGFSIAHLNHLLRGEESEQDEQFVRNLAEKSNIPIVVERKDIRTIARERKLSLEEAAREERYKFLETAARKTGANIVAVAHTADDNAETILHRIIRGSGILGIRGISLKRDLSQSSKIGLIRPLLFSWRKDIIAYLKEVDISYRNDSTNFKTDRFRNKIRLELLPILEKNYNTGVKRSLVKLGEIANQNYNFLKLQAGDLFDSVFLNKEEGKEKGKEEEKDNNFEEIVLDIPKLKEAPTILQQMIIREALIRMDVPLKKIDHKHYEEILGLIKRKKTFINKCIKGHLIACKDDKLLRLSSRKFQIKDNPVLEEVELKIPGETTLDALKYTVKMETTLINKGFLEGLKQSKSNYEEAIDFDKVETPLAIRTRKRGDKFWPLGSKGTKKIKDFFIDNKVPGIKRDVIPIVTMNGQPIWIVGFRIDDRVKITTETKTLLIMKFEGDV